MNKKEKNRPSAIIIHNRQEKRRPPPIIIPNRLDKNRTLRENPTPHAPIIAIINHSKPNAYREGCYDCLGNFTNNK